MNEYKKGKYKFNTYNKSNDLCVNDIGYLRHKRSKRDQSRTIKRYWGQTKDETKNRDE